MASSGWQGFVTLTSGGFGYDYFKGNLRIDSITHSGDTLTISGVFGVYNDGGYSSYYVYPINAKVTGQSGYTQVVAREEWINKNTWKTASFSTSFNCSAGTTSTTITVDWLYNNGTASNSISYTITFDNSYTAPSTPTVTVAERYTNGAKFNVSVSSYGTPSSASGRYIEAAILGQNTYGAPYKHSAAQNTASSAITVNNSSSGALTINSNTQYYYGGYASNTQKNKSTVTGQFYTLPSAPVASNFTQSTTTTATFSVTETSTGSAQTTQLQYCYKKHSDSSYSSWQNAGATGNQQTRSVSLSGLTAGASYDVKVRTKAGSSDYSAETTYENAFTLLNPTITVTGVSYAYDSGTDKVTATFNYTISSTGSGTETYTINATANGSDSSAVSKTFSNKPTSGTFAVNGLKRGLAYTLVSYVGTSGTTSSYNFTTPDYSPTITLGTPFKSVRGDKVMFPFSGNMGFNVTQNPSNVVAWTFKAYDTTNNAWTSAISSSSMSGQGATFTSVAMFSRDAYPQLCYQPRYSKLKVDFTVTNMHGLSTTASLIVKMPVFISGKIIKPNGSRQNIVGVMVKDTSGNITAGRYYQPFVVK